MNETKCINAGELTYVECFSYFKRAYLMSSVGLKCQHVCVNFKEYFMISGTSRVLVHRMLISRTAASSVYTQVLDAKNKLSFICILF